MVCKLDPKMAVISVGKSEIVVKMEKSMLSLCGVCGLHAINALYSEISTSIPVYSFCDHW